MTSFSGNFKIASISDIHLGHHRTLTIDVLNGLYKVFKNDKELITWDMLVIPGDLFDRLLFFTNPYFQDILLFFGFLLKKCKEHDIVVRLLEGTPAHDNKQSKLLDSVSKLLENTSKDLNVDFKHVTELSIEHIQRFNIDVLYVPDEWNTDVIDTYNETLKLMNDRRLSQVDFCLLHGAFNYQIDANLNPKAHSEELWSKLVRYYIFAGHVHFRSQWNNILVTGSFDRLAHGEEQPKGWLTCEIKSNGEHEIIFHENEYATIYKTLDVRGLSVEETINKIEEECKGFRERSHIRLFARDKDPITDSLKVIKQKYTYFYFTIKKETSETKEQSNTLKLAEDTFSGISLDKDNIVRIVNDRLLSLNTNIDISRILEVFKRFV